MAKHQFDGEEFDFRKTHAMYSAFDMLPECRRKEFLKEIHDLDPRKYENFVELLLSTHPDYDPEKYKFED
ncbi:MAG: hypothetical protein Q4P18_07190 [Methanobrevibacter sp.]|uniref:hypothetical protein n=1 Tax=Methanobrevibacter sp. TaxID=66852 RepID=UPI0026E0E006|nr:hypothetical protein [Methanobrevibacter sp.]MDO5849302.1 hypothetical protein [Methanobrevibacter sp.]